jgi:P27 family predicted phage terminase small subunit
VSGTKGHSGRKRKPTHLRLIDGNAGSRPINTAEPIPYGDIGAAPEWFSPSQVAIWNWATAQCPPGMLKAIDGSIMSVWVLAKDNFEQAGRAVNRIGQMVKGPRNTAVPNPYLKVQNQQAAIMSKAAAALGFDPTGRTRIMMPEDDRGQRSDPSNPFMKHGRRPD